MPLTPFHLAIPVRDIAEARAFYGERLGLREGRSAAHWIDFDLFGHQLVTHLDPALGPGGQVATITNGVDGETVPVPHFGVVLTLPHWRVWAAHLETVIDHFIIPPQVRFAGQPGEQATLFFTDPSGNALEFKAFADIDSQLFTR